MIQLNYASLLQSQNLRALLRAIRSGESSQDDDLAYRMRYGGAGQKPKFFSTFDTHPRVMERTPTGEMSSAAGAYQITWTTWSTVCMAKYGLGPSFTPYEQDCAAVALIHHRGALDLIIEGRFEEAVQLCSLEWASLPGSPLEDGGSKMSWARVYAVYREYGGYATSSPTQPPAPIEERDVNQEETPMGPLAFLIPLLTSLAEVFSPLLRGKLTQMLDKQVKDPVMSQQMAQQLMDIVRNVAAQGGLPLQSTPQPVVPNPSLVVPPQQAQVMDPVVAVAAVKSNPVLAAQVEEQFTDYFDRMAPVFDRMDKLEQASWQASEDSRDRAAARAKLDPVDIGPTLATKMFWLFVGLAGLVAALLGVQMWFAEDHRASGELVGLFIALVTLAGNKLSTIVDYRFGSSRSSATKDVMVEELALRRGSVK